MTARFLVGEQEEVAVAPPALPQAAAPVAPTVPAAPADPRPTAPGALDEREGAHDVGAVQPGRSEEADTAPRSSPRHAKPGPRVRDVGLDKPWVANVSAAMIALGVLLVLLAIVAAL